MPGTGFRSQFSRRGFVRGAAALGASAVGVSAFAGCGSDGTGESSSSDDGGSDVGSGVRGGELELPTYQRAEVVVPDLPGSAEGVPEGYFSYPRPAEPAAGGPPGSGGVVTAMLGAVGPVPPNVGQNPWWQGLNERLGVDLQVNMTPVADYGARLNTVIAGGDLPDLVQIFGVARLPDVMEAEFEDLTEYLAGDGVLDYPFLANLPTVGWQATVFNSKIYAVPPQNTVKTVSWLTRLDLIDELGANPQPGDADEFFDFCLDVTDAAANRYASAAPAEVLNRVARAMFDAPWQWGVDDDGAFVHMYETEEYRAALEYTARLWDAGVFHPDSFGSVNLLEFFKGGTTVLHNQGGNGYRAILDENIPGLRMGIFTPPMADGGGPARAELGTGTYRITAIRKQDSQERVRELLELLNYLAAPFGSEEYLYLQYGDENVHYTWDEDLQAPVRTEQDGELIPVRFLAGAPQVFFDPGHAEFSKAMHEHHSEAIPGGVQDDSARLYSETNDRQASSLFQPLNGLRNDIVQGRNTLDDWDKAIEDWRASGGDQIREEFEIAHAEFDV
ncbi:extracellular solute-binding protein [Phytoactinopolyspora limicola]|uniref:extracellular solute-binding protein n=1 Tax=Phytoactinopolyspora limicola TaxID=2715536 RepID=UPI00140DCE99|nr:extracellular solute-binding protein [Phytoactinopolyspora limicola]